MRLLLFALIFSTMSLMAANDLELYVVDGQAGKIDDHNVDVSQVAPGGTITLGVRINNYDFTLAGMEIEARFARYVYRMQEGAVWSDDATRPIKPDAAGWENSAVQQLPAGPTGAENDSTLNNGFGTVRFGILALSPGNRPDGDGTSSVNIGTIEIYANNEDLATCISGREIIQLFACDNVGGGACDIFANGSAERVAMNFDSADVEVALTRPGVPVRGDTNGDGTFDTADIVGLISCVNGLACGVPEADRAVVLDINCSNPPGDTGDVIPSISIANRIVSFRGKRALGNYNLSGDSLLTIDSGDRSGALMSLEFASPDNDIKFDAANFEGKGWYVDTYYSERERIFKVTVANLMGGNATFPKIEIPVSVNNRTGLTLIQSEYRNADNNLMDFIPAVAAGDANNSREGLRDSGNNGRTRN